MTDTDRAPRPTARPGRRGRGRPRGASSAATRRQVLDAATQVIGTNGYGATSMAAVAQAAGISPSGLAHYFSSREELLAAVLERRDELDHSSRRCTPRRSRGSRSRACARWWSWPAPIWS